MKIVFLDAYTLNPGDLDWQPLTDLGEVIFYDRTKPEEIIERIGDAEVVLVNKVKLNKSHFEQLPQLKFIGVTATGFDVIDTKAASAHNIVVTNVKGYSSDSVAQHTFALLLELYSQVGKYAHSVQSGDWYRSEDFCYWNTPLTELAGKTIGLVGLGGIGERVAAIALAFGMKVLVHKRTMEPIGLPIHYVDLQTLFASSDVVSLHCPLTEFTKELVNATTLSYMKKNAVLINTARGGLIREVDLAEALNTQRIAGAALDVLTIEPPRENHPLIGAHNCLITPHQAWASTEARERLLKMTVENIIAYREGKPMNVVNKAV